MPGPLLASSDSGVGCSRASLSQAGRATGDLILAGVVVALTAIPDQRLSWAALTIASIYVSRVSPAGSAMERGSLICLALTAPMLWGPTLLSTYYEPFQRIDALLVSGLTGTERVGNLVKAADGSAYIQIAYTCSSFHNISLAILAWAAASLFVGMRRTAAWVGWGLLGCASVLSVNVVRIGLIALYPAL